MPGPADAVVGDASADRPRRWHRVFLGAVLPLLVVVGVLGLLEIRTSWLQSRIFTGLAEDVTYWLEPGPSPAIRYPSSGPYDVRMGYTEIPGFIERLEERGFQVTAQARMSRGMLRLLDRGVFAVYREKPRGGLVVEDRHGGVFFESLNPVEVYEDFDSIPELVWRTLLFIENRELLDEGHPRRNPAVEWDRLALSVGDLALKLAGSERNVPGGSTLATQIEKFRHSPEGRTSSPVNKLEQIATASLRAYADGPNTLEARKRVVRTYLNSVPLSAIRGHGEVTGLADGLEKWYGTEFEEANQLLRADPSELSGDELARRATVFRQVVGLMLAQRRPSYYLIDPEGRTELAGLVDQHVRLMVREGWLSSELADQALEQTAELRMEAPELPPPPFVERKAANQVRSSLLTLLGVPRLYDLDRLDLTVRTTLDMEAQDSVARVLARMTDRAFLAENGFLAQSLLSQGDPSRVIYSFTLSEATPNGAAVRVQTDNFDGPFNINEGSRIELGSTAKLRTLVSYLEVVEDLHDRLQDLSPAELRAERVHPRDRLSRWAVDHLSDNPDASTADMLQAAMQRRYSGNPSERFVTGGGSQTFANFDATYNNSMLTVLEAFRHSVNLVFVRMMRDIVAYYMFGSGSSTASVLEGVDDPARQTYLSRFAHDEGGKFVEQFYRKYAGKVGSEIFEQLVTGRRLTPQRMAWAFRTVAPDATLDVFADFITAHTPNTHLTEGTLQDLYQRTSPESQTLADLGFLASVHPLELWVAGYLLDRPQATRAEVLEASTPFRQDVYGWLFNTRRRNAQDRRIYAMVEVEAFTEVLASWQRLGYPFDNIVPSLGTSIGSSGDRPAALAELVGIIVSGGIRYPSYRVTGLHAAKDTPYETILERRPGEGVRVLSPEVAAAARDAMVDVVERGTARRAAGSARGPDGRPLVIGGKTGTGDNRFRVFAPGGRMVESRPVNRTSTFVFFVGDRWFGVVTAYVPGPEAAAYRFTSALPSQVLKVTLPRLPMFRVDGERATEGG